MSEVKQFCKNVTYSVRSDGTLRFTFQVYSSELKKTVRTHADPPEGYSIKNIRSRELKAWVEEKRAEFIQSVVHKRYSVDSTITFSRYYEERYLKKELNIKAATLQGYQIVYRKHVKDYLGNVKLEDIDRDLLQRYQKWMSDNGRSDSVRKAAHKLVRLVLNQAKYDKIIPDNPALGKGIAPKDTVKIVKALREEEISAFLDLMDTEDFKWRCLVYLLAYSGIRRSEACALAWKDVDFAGNRFYVVQSASKVIGGGVEVGYTKTNMSTRDEPLTEPVRGMLWELRQREGGVGYVFKNVYNAHEPMHPDSVTNFFAKFCRKWGIRDITPHMLRRSMASVMNRNGIDTKTAQKILGHTDSRTTSKYYLNSDSLDVQNAFNVLGKAIGSKRGKEGSVELLKECSSLSPMSEAPATPEKTGEDSPELPEKSGAS
ncbi:MAG: site-specific integrase [archaeon]|nr:site-specific integrase [archaeon]